MSVEEEKEVNQNEGVRGLLREDHKAELGKILAFGEKYKEEGEKMGGRFWETVCDDDMNWYDRDGYVNLLAQYDENRKLIEEGLLEEEKQVLNELTDIARDKFYDKYLYDKIVYSGNPDGYGETLVKYGGDFSKEDLMSWIKSLKDSLKLGVSLDLGGGAYNPPGEYCKWMGDEGVKMVAKELKDSLQPGMRIFLSWNKIGAEGAKAMARDWKGKLQPGMDIDLLSNRIGDDGVKAMAEEWKDSLKSGMHIDLGDNKIGDDGVKAMAEEWKDSLKPGINIDLQSNNIGPEGVKILAKKWKDKLQPGMHINLRNNEIGDEGIKALAKEWKNSLKPGMVINLGRSEMGLEGAKAIASERKNKLQPGMIINLGDNEIGDEGVEAIVREWKDSLQPGITVGLLFCNLSDKGLKKIMEGWKDSLQPGMKLLLGYSCDKNVGKELKEWEQSYKERGINCKIDINDLR